MANGGTAVAIRSDMTDLSALEIIFRVTLEGLKTDRINILINNAGLGPNKHLKDIDLKFYDRLMNVINCVNPGPVDTDVYRAAISVVLAHMEERNKKGPSCSEMRSAGRCCRYHHIPLRGTITVCQWRFHLC